MKTLGIASLMQRSVDTATPVETVQTAAHRMQSRNVGTLVVVDEGERPIGIVTDRDIALRIVAPRASCDTPLADVMTGEIESIPADASVDTALQRMREYGVRRLPVVDGDDRLVGIVSLEDVIAFLSRAMSEVGWFLQQQGPARLARP